MLQIIQEVGTGKTALREIPAPIALPGHVIVRTAASLVSAGTERYVVDLARKSLIGKACERPDHVLRVLQKIRQEGFFSTLSQVKAKLDEPMPLGYSSSGVVVECGAGVSEFKPGDRVATAGPHAGVVCVSRNLCAKIPEGLSFEQAAYTAVAAIGLQGIRLVQPTLGERVLVIGLGLIGLLCVCLLKACGCSVFGIDLDEAKTSLATKLGADAVSTRSDADAVRAFSRNAGVDAAVIAAATTSNEPIEFAADACRMKGRIVLVGVVGLNLPRPPFFQKELTFSVSSSLGPGRGDPLYEDKGIDYPLGYARWTAQRNMQAVLQMCADGKLPVERLTTHRFEIEEASKAYDLITEKRQPHVGIVIKYPPCSEEPKRRVDLRQPRVLSGSLGISMVGAGNFARLVMLPILKDSAVAWRGLCTAKGINAQHSGDKMGFAFSTTDAAEIWNDPQTQAVFVATRHDLHAGLVLAALRAGKHVFVEKPLCISLPELDEIESCIRELGDRCPLLTVGFNRRFAPATAVLKDHFRNIAPLSLSYRFSPGHIPSDHWTQDMEVGGGRIVGEACHAIDTCVAIADSPPEKVYAESVAHSGDAETTDDRAVITIRHRNGSVSSISYQCGGDRAFPAERIEVFGGGRTAVIDAWDRIELWTVSRCRRSSGRKDKGHKAEFEAFIEACRKGGAWPISWEHLHGVTWASLMAMRSRREGIPFLAGYDEEPA